MSFNDTTKIFFWCILIVVGLVLSSCTPPPPLEVSITSLSACKDWDKTGNPLGVSKIFSPNEERISVCGHLQTNDPPITLSVNWYYEDKLITTEVVRDVFDNFHSSIEPSGENFAIGDYQVEVFVGKRVMQSVEFRVE